ncbi:hypothetical protein EYF80_032345 [Liparis tanakae]|uniref:Uncharacterized protein n=1 Tax=Liparis tanakae TaxID=230148 RepID=A0A4Z2GUX8_9TELE|nr:hypothetical protein EYF80_032345 [Liparis tanakae]
MREDQLELTTCLICEKVIVITKAQKNPSLNHNMTVKAAHRHRAAAAAAPVGVRGTYRMSSSLANMMTALALEVSSRRLMILSNSPDLGSLGIFKDWAIHTPPGTQGDGGNHQYLIQ